MEKLNNVQKAIEIAKSHEVIYDRFLGETSNDECFLSALEMAEWKDKEFAKERHELIQKANDAVNKANETMAELVRDRIRTNIEQWLTEHGLEWELEDILDLI